jgi:type II secretory ATPase GspE/PulE/Tfp pilus assembly ATPase PilB-like protein
MIEPNDGYIKIIFKKDQMVKDIKYIKYHIYSNIILKAKKISKLNLEESNVEQK